MYFFRIEIYSFDDAAKTFYIVPEQNADEKGVPFDTKFVMQTTEYKQLLKDTQTSIVDGNYIEYKTDMFTETITQEQFEQLKNDNKLQEIETNNFTIQTGFKSKKGGRLDIKMILIIGAAAVLGIGGLALTFSKDIAPKEQEVTETSETTVIPVLVSETTAETEVSEVTTEDTTADTTEPPTESTEEYVDKPAETVEEAEEDTDESGYTRGGYSGRSTSSSSNSTGEYTITFSLNGGEGIIEPITSKAGQYVTLPLAETVSKTVSKKGHKLIGFSDNTEIAYPLYDYKMPSENVTLFAVWEPDTFIVTYNSNGGTGQLSRAEVRYGSEIPLPTDVSVYKKDLYLSGWAETDNAKSALKALKMPAEDITLYAVWDEKPPVGRITLHYDNSVQIVEKEIGSTVDMLDSFGIFKDGYSVEGWYFENSPVRIENLYVDGDCDLYAKWQEAEYITVTIDRSYLNAKPEQYKIPLDMTGKGTLRLPAVDNKADIFSHVEGCTYGYSDKPQTEEYGTIKYFGDTECEFTHDTTLYRVLNVYGGGKGTKENPYVISYYDQLLRLAEQGAKGYFIQTEDISFPSSAERKPIDTVKLGRGYDNKNYDLFVYDGQGHTVKGLSGEGGLFGEIAGSTIKNVVIEGASIKTGKYQNVGIVCNSVYSYFFKSSDDTSLYGVGNSKITGCTVKNCKINGESADNVGGIGGYGGIISDCYAEQVEIIDGKTVGGIVGNACTVNGCITKGITVSDKTTSAGGIAGTAYGTQIYDSGEKPFWAGGTIIGCGVRTFASKAVNSGGIVGTATSDGKSAYIKSCYVANIYLNGKNNGGIAGADGKRKGHRIAYCICDDTNGYAVIGARISTVSKTMVLAVPADNSITVDGVLSVLNAAGSGYDKWKRSDNINSGYPYPPNILF